MLESVFRRPRVVARIRDNCLADSLTGLVVYLRGRGHPVSTIQMYVQVSEHFGQWLKTEGICPSRVNSGTVERFLKQHLPKCRCLPPSSCYINNVRAGLRHLLVVLQERYQHLPQPHKKISLLETALQAYQIHMEETCGLASTTCYYRRRYAREFLMSACGARILRRRKIRPGDLVRFFVERVKGYNPGSAQVMASSIRAYLRFLHMEGVCDSRLAAAIPSLPNWKRSSPPRTLNAEQVDLFLASFDRATPTGLRDYAMALCLSELGLRVSDVAHLRLEDINWRQATLRIEHGKSRRVNILPLPKMVGRAIALYLRKGRPSTTHRALFICHTVPVGEPIGMGMIRGVMGRAFNRSGVCSFAWPGTHILRHTAATRMLEKGVSLKEIADILGHRSLDTTATYAKVNLPLLREVALPWPEVPS